MLKVATLQPLFSTASVVLAFGLAPPMLMYYILLFKSLIFQDINYYWNIIEVIVFRVSAAFSNLVVRIRIMVCSNSDLTLYN